MFTEIENENENLEEEELTDEQKAAAARGKKIGDISKTYGFHIKTRKNRQSHVSLRDKENFNSDIDACEEVLSFGSPFA